MANSHHSTFPSSISKEKENVCTFSRPRPRTSKYRKRKSPCLSSSSNSFETVSSSSDHMQGLPSLMQRQVNNTQQRRCRKNKHVIVVNYKPIFINSRHKKSSQNSRSTPVTVSKPRRIPIDDNFSLASHYDRRCSLTTTSSDGSPLHSTSNRSHDHQSITLDVPDVEDPLMFIELMYQQLFTEDGRLRSGTKATTLANCVKQIVTNSRRNSLSSSIANKSPSSHLKHMNLNRSHQQRKFSSPSNHHLSSSKSASLCSSPRLIPGEYNSTFSEEKDEEEEEEEESHTLRQTNNYHSTVQTNTDVSKK